MRFPEVWRDYFLGSAAASLVEDVCLQNTVRKDLPCFKHACFHHTTKSAEGSVLEVLYIYIYTCNRVQLGHTF